MTDRIDLLSCRMDHRISGIYVPEQSNYKVKNKKKKKKKKGGMYCIIGNLDHHCFAF